MASDEKPRINPRVYPIDEAAYAQAKDQYNSLWHYVFRQEWESYVEQ